MDRLKQIYGENYEQNLLRRLDQELNRRGMIDCLRHGIRDRGVRLRLVYNKPPSTLNKLLMENYRKNIFTVSRQVYYSHQHHTCLEVDLFLFGFPIDVLVIMTPNI